MRSHVPLAVDWLRSWRMAFPVVAAAICPCINNSLGINAVPPVSAQSSGDWQQTDREGVKFAPNTGGLSGHKVCDNIQHICLSSSSVTKVVHKKHVL